MTTGLYGATITWWNVSGSSHINVGSGAVDRPPNHWGDRNITIKADIQKGSTKLEKEFYLTVKAADLTDQECVLLDNAALDWDTIKGSNSTEDDITANLASLPTEGANGTTITWTVEPDGQTWLSIPSGALTRPTTAEGNQTITLTATISKGSVQQTKPPFTLVLKASVFAEGNGTAQYPYLVGSASDLELVRSFLGIGNSGVHFRQTADITLTGNWTPLGDISTYFFGHYDGDGYVISGLRIDGGQTLSGLFGYTGYTAVLENILLEDAYIRSNTNLIQNSGALCGYNNGTVRNCSATGQVIAAYGTNQAKAGVLIGSNSGTVERCWSAGSVTINGMETVMAGGLVGQNGNGGSVTDCYSRASAYAGGNYGSAGGLVGDNSGGVIQKSYSTGTANADGTGSAAGGLAGTQSGGGSVSLSFYNSQTSGRSDTGKGTPATTVDLKKQTTFTGWDFASGTGVWRIMEDYTYPVLQWQDLTADEIITLDVLALSWDTIKGDNSAANNVADDLSLPANGTKGAFITWEASPAGCINTADGTVTRPYDADITITLTARVNYTGGEEQTKSFTVTVKLMPVPPTIDGPTTMTLTEGYSATSTGGYTITGTEPVTVEKTSGDAKITWNSSTKKLDIAAGLTPGSYTVNLKAVNATLTDATLSFTLTVDALVNAQAPIIANNLADKTTTVGIPVELDATAAVADGGTISYAWYRNTVRQAAGAAALGVTTPAYAPDVSAVGTAYYYCVVTNTNNAVNGVKTASVTSAIAEVRVNPAPPTVTGIEVNPPSVTVQKGTSYQFGATVNGTNNPSQSVTWGVSGQNDGGTVISPSGLLSVAAGETAETLSVTATSVFDNTKSGTAAVSLTDAAPPAPVVNAVAVIPDTITLNRGDSHTFSAFVSGTNSPAQGVTWSVEGGNGITAIVADGTLTIAADETALILTIRATSTIDSTKSGTAAVTVVQPAPAVYPVTFTAETGGSITIGASGSYEAGAVINITAVPDSGYQFTQWTTSDGGSFANANSASTAFTVPANATTVTAAFVRRSSGGSAPSMPAEPEYKAKVNEGNGEEATLPVTVDKNNKSASVDAGSRSFAEGGAIITIPTVPEVDVYSVSIPVPSLSTADAQGTLTVNTDNGSVIVPSNMLTGVAGVSGGKAQISIAQGDKETLPDDVKAAIGDRPLVQLTLSIDGKQTDWSNSAAPVTVSIPYTPTAAELANPESIVVWYIDGSGNVVTVPNGRYDAVTGTVSFFTTHFSDYAVTYVHKTFSDLGSVEWAKKAIETMASKGITNGTDDGTTFSPTVNITRADFMVLLIKTLGLTAEFTENFDDVKPGTYYYNAIGVTRKLGIAAGSGNNLFKPTESISRQDMMVLAARALEKYQGLETAETNALLERFTDRKEVAEYASQSLATLIEAGITEGSGGRLTPRAYTTRAEAAAFLYKIYNKYPNAPVMTDSTLTRLAGQSRIDTALAAARAAYPEEIKNAVISTAYNYPDALAGSVLAYQLDAPILLAGSAEAEQLNVKTGTPVGLVSGENYPDALSVSSMAAQRAR